MGFYIECHRGAEIVHAEKSSTISVDQIKQVVDDTKQVSAPAFKGDDETHRATFAATTPEGKFIWHVNFSVGDGEACVDDVALISAPSDVVIQSGPIFRVRCSNS